MKPYPIGELSPYVHIIVRWCSKEQFVYDREPNETWTLFIPESGEFRYEIGSHRGTATFGDLVLCPPDVLMERAVIRPLTFLAVYFDWYAEGGRKIESEHELTPHAVGKCALQDTQRLFSSNEYLKKVIKQKDPASVYRRNFLLQDLWQLYAWETSSAAQDKIRQPIDTLMRQAESLLRESSASPVNMKSISGELGLSAVQFTRRFKAAYGVTPSDYVTSLRLSRARTLLAETKLTLEQIALQCGYENGLYLSRIFSKKMNVSPSQYRKAHFV
ncbi:AraC family transcriptional regulator [Paenibacillus sp. GCM10012303]|uniref:AraC family transcriptional regulator n=1 Tax=Paenibacillus sp. GCM10012303 TaxID=3317340 RepID=UPI00361CAFCC